MNACCNKIPLTSTFISGQLVQKDAHINDAHKQMKWKVRITNNQNENLDTWRSFQYDFVDTILATEQSNQRPWSTVLSCLHTCKVWQTKFMSNS